MIDLSCESSSVGSQTMVFCKHQRMKRCTRECFGFEREDVEGSGRGNEVMRSGLSGLSPAAAISG